jgi:hypothetical protein
VFEEPGSIIVFHGFGSSESNTPGEEDVIRVEETLDLPAYATDATVFLNGWRLQYISGDHNVAGLGTVIRNIKKERNTLRWEAVGVLSDDNFDDGYRWWYRYTVIAWNSTNINLIVDHVDGQCGDTVTKYFNEINRGTTTALAAFPTFLQNSIFSSANKLTILPRGFGFKWNSDDDHDLLQLSYNMGYSENFLENKKEYHKSVKDTLLNFFDSASHIGKHFLSWESSAIFKDNGLRREYKFGELVSGIGGNDIGVIEPPFSILPIEDEVAFWGSCTQLDYADSVQFIVKDIPFQFAIPVLSGWDLGYGTSKSGCYDANVKDIGIWIDSWKYGDPTDPPGTLRYKLSAYMKDKNNDPAYYHRQRVSILGIRAIQRRVTGGQ